MTTNAKRFGGILLVLLGLPGCFYRSVSEVHTLEIGFVGGAAQYGSLPVLKEPAITLQPSGCSGSAGLVAPPVIFELWYEPGTAITLPDFAKLSAKNRDVVAYRIETRTTGGDRIEISFMIRCPELDGAILQIGPFQVEQQSVVLAPINFRHASRTESEWNRLPDEWWR